jgi:hypothetical protein
VLFAFAAGLIAVDKFGNISENWMRHVISSLTLQRMLVDFQLAGVAASGHVPSAAVAGNADARDEGVNQAQDDETVDLEEQYDRIKMFLASVFDLVRHETQEWADEYRKNRSDLEGYLKVQDAANKTDERLPKGSPPKVVKR